MSEYIIHIEDAKTLYGNVDFLFPLDAYLREGIVRCRDCIYFATDELGDYCTMFDFGNVKNMENGFCAWGERKENGCQ